MNPFIAPDYASIHLQIIVEQIKCRFIAENVPVQDPLYGEKPVFPHAYTFL